jgi:hypothetical protein
MFPGGEIYDVSKFLYDVSRYKKGDKAKIIADLVALGIDGAAAFADEIIDAGKMAKRVAAKRICKAIDDIIFEGASEVTKVLRKKAYNEFAAATKGMYGSVEESANIFMRILKEESPWPLDFVPTKKTLHAGEEFHMAISSSYQILEDGTIKPGAFATTDYITNVNYVRNKLAVKSHWKSGIDKVVTFRVKEGMSLPVNVGPVGSQIDEAVGKYLPGGGNQIEILVPREDYSSIFKQIR